MGLWEAESPNPVLSAAGRLGLVEEIPRASPHSHPPSNQDSLLQGESLAVRGRGAALSASLLSIPSTLEHISHYFLLWPKVFSWLFLSQLICDYVFIYVLAYLIYM